VNSGYFWIVSKVRVTQQCAIFWCVHGMLLLQI
jgi:hypothetical protein